MFLENLRNIINIRLVNNAKDYIRYIIKPIFVLQKIFSKNFVAIREIKPVLTLNKPIYVGFSILDDDDDDDDYDDDDDDELFLWYDLPMKDIQLYFQPEPLSEILTIVNLRHAASRI